MKRSNFRTLQVVWNLKALPRITFLLLLGITLLQAGEWRERLERTRDRVLRGGPPYYTEEFLLADLKPQPIRRFTNFSGDLSGRYLSALAALCPADPAACETLRHFQAKVLKYQRPEGYFGAPASADVPNGWRLWWFLVKGAENDHMALLWGNGRMLVGLVEAWEITRDPLVLHAARRLAGYLERSAEAWDHPLAEWRFRNKRATGYICWTQNAEGLALLARATKEPRYQELAHRVGSRLERHPNQHSHGYLSTMRALTLLAEDDPQTLRRVEQAWAELIDSGNVTIVRSIPELFLPFNTRDEGCSNADWLRWNLDLWRITGTTRYLETAERALFNGFAFSQLSNGDFGHRYFADGGFRGSPERAWWCCTLHGLRALPEIRRFAMTEQDGEVSLLLPVDAELSRPGAVIARSISTLETDGRVRLELAPSVQRVSVRIPYWAESMTASGAGWLLASQSSTKLDLRADSPGAGTVEVMYRMRQRRQTIDRGSLIWYGPWLLGIGRAISPHYFDEPLDGNRMDPDLAPKQRLPGQPYPRVRGTLRQGGYSGQPSEVELLPLAADWRLPSAEAWAYRLPIRQPDETSLSRQ